MRSVGVTGTNGKTTTTTWVAAALAAVHAPAFRATTLGHFVGDEKLAHGAGYAGFAESARTAATRGATLAAIELTSQALWSGAARAWPCEVGVFTNFSTDHLDAHGDAEHYLASKAQLFVSLPPGGCAVLNGCDAVYPLLAEVVPKGTAIRSYGYGERGPALTKLDVAITDVEVSWQGTTLTLDDERTGKRPLSLRAIGEVFAENAAAAWVGAVAMGVPPDVAAAAIAREPAPAGRFQVVHRHPFVVVDYAHTPDALARTCRTARGLALQGGGKLALVFGAGGNRDQGKRATMGREARVADRVIITSDNPRDEDPAAIAAAIASGLGVDRAEIVLDRTKAIERAVAEVDARDVVLVCGKGHETEQIIGGIARHFSDYEVIEEATYGRKVTSGKGGPGFA
jgi:UDP-N-acetylmuramoyl-L-alanyl-D-glutamate--2,6-diaminopimelate ligase